MIVPTLVTAASEIMPPGLTVIAPVPKGSAVEVPILLASIPWSTVTAPE